MQDVIPGEGDCIRLAGAKSLMMIEGVALIDEAPDGECISAIRGAEFVADEWKCSATVPLSARDG